MKNKNNKNELPIFQYNLVFRPGKVKENVILHDLAPLFLFYFIHFLKKIQAAQVLIF